MLAVPYLFIPESGSITSDTSETRLFYTEHISNKFHNFDWQHFAYNFEFCFFERKSKARHDQKLDVYRLEIVDGVLVAISIVVSLTQV